MKWAFPMNAQDNIWTLFGSVCLSGSVGVDDLIPWKTLWRTSIRHPSLLPDVVLSVLLKRERAKALWGMETERGIQTDSQDGVRIGRFRLTEQKGRHKRHREREAESSNLGSFLVKLHQGELLLNCFSLIRCLRIIGDSELIINGYKLIHWQGRWLLWRKWA